MFEVKLYLNELEKPRAKESTQYEIVTGKVKLFRIQNENISLTDKCEYFRFLPIRRNKIVQFYLFSYL
jgi:hypothetical protein